MLVTIATGNLTGAALFALAWTHWFPTLVPVGQRTKILIYAWLMIAVFLAWQVFIWNRI